MDSKNLDSKVPDYLPVDQPPLLGDREFQTLLEQLKEPLLQNFLRRKYHQNLVQLLGQHLDDWQTGYYHGILAAYSELINLPKSKEDTLE